MIQNERFSVPRGQRQLFLDDYGVARIDNLDRTLHQPDKKGAVVRSDLLHGGTVQIRTAPIWDPEEKKWKLWAIDFSITPPSMQGRAGFSCYYESQDGVHWTKPVVGLAEYRGSRENNLVYLPVDEGRTAELFCVVHDPDDSDPSRRFKGFTYDREHNHLIFGASPDGRQWHRLDTPPVRSQDECNLSFDANAHQFIATVKQPGPYGRSHALSTSKDFEHWTKPELIFHADEEDQQLAREVIERHVADPALQKPIYNDPADYAADIYNFPVSRYEGLYIAFPAIFYHMGARPAGNHDGIHHVQIACSRDMRTWHRVGERQPFLSPSPVGAGAYDTMQILPPSYPIARDGQLWFYYSGHKYRHVPETADPDISAVCLATLRQDGFVSLDADETEGSVTTQPFRLEGEQLYVNAMAAGGELTCELVDTAGDPIPGFGRSNCIPVTEDGIRQSITWRGAPTLSPSSTSPVQLRVYLRRASLYSYWFDSMATPAT